MNLLIMGLSHRSAPLDVLEHVAVSCADTDKVLPQLLPREPVTKTLLLSTCNQVEIYAVVATFHDGLAKITDILAHQSAMTPDHLSPHLCVHHAAASIEHLFPVAAGRHLPGPVTNIRTGAFIPTLRETPITNESTRR